MGKGTLVVIEGIDMAGKSTQVELLMNNLKTLGYSCVTYHFPAKETVFGQEIYAFLNDQRDYSNEVVELLHTADKTNGQKIIEQLLWKNDYVILDRYKLTQYSYALAKGLDPDWLNNLTKYVREPDIKIMLNIAPEEAVKRKKNLDKYERDTHYLYRVYSNMYYGASQFGYTIIDATKIIEEIQEDILKIIFED